MDELTFLEKDEDTIKQEIFQIALEETGLMNLKSTGVLRGFLEVLYRVVSAFYSQSLSTIYKQANLDDARGIWLNLWGLMLGVVRQKAVKTAGLITLNAYQSGSVTAGSWIRVDGTDYRFKILDDTNFNAGISEVQVEAEFPGSIYNMPEGQSVSFSQVIAGIEDISFGWNWITTAGEEEEDDDHYRAQIKTKWNAQGVGNPPAKYVLNAQSVNGVKDVKVIRTPRGFGSMDLYISSTTGLKTESIKTAVENSMENSGLVCRDFVVRWPEDLKADYLIEYSGSYTEEEIESVLRAYILDIPMGGTLEKRSLYGWLDDYFPLLESLEIISPARDITASNAAANLQRILPPITGDDSGFSLQVIKNG